MSPGPWRGKGHEGDLRLDADENLAVEEAHRRAVKRQLELDEALETTRRATARHNSYLEGLRYSLKSLESFRSKVARRHALKTAAATANSTNDLNRYTLTFPREQYTEGVLACYENLRAQGFVKVKDRNSWNTPDYRGINSTWAIVGPNGKAQHLFEVQFHTPEGFEVKDKYNHLLYELDRADQSEDPDRRLAIRQLQAERYGDMEPPPGHERICAPQPSETLLPASQDSINKVLADEEELRQRKAAEAQEAAEREADRETEDQERSQQDPLADPDEDTDPETTTELEEDEPTTPDTNKQSDPDAEADADADADAEADA